MCIAYDRSTGAHRDEYAALRRLCWAILDDAIATLEIWKRHPTAKHAREARDVLDWIRCEDEDWPLSFRSVCGAIGRHADRVRTMLRARGLLR